MSAYTKRMQNAAVIGGGLALSAAIAGSGTLTTTQVAIGVAHGLGATPDFVLSQSSLAVGAGAPSGKFGWTANATTITFTKADTGATETFSYIVGILA